MTTATINTIVKMMESLPAGRQEQVVDHLREYLADLADEAECPICGGEMITKEVEKLLRGGVHTASIYVQADVCLRCGERLYAQETVRQFEQIRAKLERQELDDFQPLGQSFTVPGTAD